LFENDHPIPTRHHWVKLAGRICSCGAPGQPSWSRPSHVQKIVFPKDANQARKSSGGARVREVGEPED